MNFNKAIVLGNVTRDPEVRSLPSGQQVTSFSIATNRYYTSQAGEKKEDLRAVIDIIAQHTRQYAKRQNLFLKKQI